MLDENAWLYLDAPTTTRAVAALEEKFLRPGGIMLRLGVLYALYALYAPEVAIGAALAKGRYRQPADADGITSFVHVDDAAQATLQAVDSGVPGTFNITDDEPVVGSKWLPGLAALLGGPPPRTIPADMASRLLGWFPAYQLTELCGASTERACQALGWKPRHPDRRAGSR